MLEYALGWQNCMPAFTTIINNIYLFLIPVGVLIGMHTTDFREYSLTFIFYLIIVHAISGILNKIMFISESFTQIDGSVERMDEILRIPVLPEKNTSAVIQNYDIAFQDVSFSYETDSQVKALAHVSFLAPQGKVTAVVGPSGGGKSTIANLISRFYDVTDGSIKIGGVDIRDIPLDALMDKVNRTPRRQRTQLHLQGECQWHRTRRGHLGRRPGFSPVSRHGAALPALPSRRAGRC